MTRPLAASARGVSAAGDFIRGGPGLTASTLSLALYSLNSAESNERGFRRDLAQQAGSSEETGEAVGACRYLG
jgi:hypothetical protein